MVVCDCVCVHVRERERERERERGGGGGGGGSRKRTDGRRKDVRETGLKVYVLTNSKSAAHR